MTIAGGHPAITMGTKWIGTDGWVWVDRSGFDASNPEWIKMDSLPESMRKIKLYESAEHRRNFLDSVKSRKPTITPVEAAHHSIIPGHLGLISMLVGRKLNGMSKRRKSLATAKLALYSRGRTARPGSWPESATNIVRQPRTQPCANVTFRAHVYTIMQLTNFACRPLHCPVFLTAPSFPLPRLSQRYRQENY